MRTVHATETRLIQHTFLQGLIVKLVTRPMSHGQLYYGFFTKA